MKTILGWLFALSPVWTLLLGVAVLEHNVLYRTSCEVNGVLFHIDVKRDHKLGVASLFGYELFEENGKVMARYGCPGPRGHLPIISTQPATSTQIALYRRFF